MIIKIKQEITNLNQLTMTAIWILKMMLTAQQTIRLTMINNKEIQQINKIKIRIKVTIIINVTIIIKTSDNNLNNN